MNLLNHTVIGAEMALAWDDGKENYIPLETLRRSCPCALCQGEPDALGRVIKPKVNYTPRSFELIRMTLIGGYALQLTWADGHSSGIYPFSLLRSIDS
ncbi:MAG: DUF971 domain-containing protein [Akkermansiaceae bacterium]